MPAPVQKPKPHVGGETPKQQPPVPPAAVRRDPIEDFHLEIALRESLEDAASTEPYGKTEDVLEVFSDVYLRIWMVCPSISFMSMHLAVRYPEVAVDTAEQLRLLRLMYIAAQPLIKYIKVPARV